MSKITAKDLYGGGQEIQDAIKELQALKNTYVTVTEEMATASIVCVVLSAPPVYLLDYTLKSLALTGINGERLRKTKMSR